MLEVKIKRYIWIRIVVYMYLSIFYLYFALYLQNINYYLFLVLIGCEIILLIFLREIIDYMNVRYFKELAILYKEGVIGEEFMEMVVKLRDPLEIGVRLKFELNKYIWDKTLSNAVVLNILYKYMVWVNKNTEGYYDRKMNIRSRVHVRLFLEERSIIWDILPRTRYVIISFKYLGYECGENITNEGISLTEQYEFINLSKNKKFIFRILWESIQ